MNKLLSANFARLKKSKAFWICMLLMFLSGVFFSFYYSKLTGNGYPVSLDNMFFNCMVYFGVFAASFISLFVGTEYSDGTIRNKLAVGHTRVAIYLSNAIVSAVACLFMGLSYMTASVMFGIPLVGSFRSDSRVVAFYLFLAVLLILAFSAIFTMLALLIQNKAVVAMVSLIGFFICFFAMGFINSMLSEPEVYPEYVYIDDEGNVVVEEEMPNPNYVPKEKRAFYEFLYDFLPTGQSMQIVNMNASRVWRLPLYSLLIIGMTNVGGVLFFGKKDLK